MKLREWRKAKGWEQSTIAEKIGSNQKTYSAYETGRLKDIPPDIQARIRKLGYQGPWPREEAKEAAAPAGGAYVTREEFAEERGALRAEIRLLREGMEKMGEVVRLLLQEREESRQARR